MTFCIAGWVVSRFRELVLSDTVLAPAFFGAVTAPSVTLLCYLLLLKEGLVSVPLTRVAVKTIGTGCLALVATPLAFWLAGGLDRLAGNVDLRESTLNGF